MKDYSDIGIQIPSGKTRGKLKVFCPQCHETRHDKRDKSLSVDLDKGVWNCHYCGWGGTINVSDYDDSPEGKQRITHTVSANRNLYIRSLCSVKQPPCQKRLLLGSRAEVSALTP